MKIWNLIIIAFALSISANAHSTQVEDGIDRGNGGDEFSQAFVNVGYELVESLTKEPLAGVDARALLAAV